MKPLVYLAAPYSAGDPVANTHAVLEVATELMDSGLCYPVIPHLTLFLHLYRPRPYDYWIGYDLAILRRCDALLRLPGDSPGADGEVAEAQQLGMPIAYDLHQLHRQLWALECREFGCHDGGTTGPTSTEGGRAP